jgi:adenylosuccinate lyase
MIPRYSHPLVGAEYSDRTTYVQWARVELATLAAQIRHGIVPAEQEEQALRALAGLDFTQKAVNQIQAIEREVTHHDVAAFLFWVRKECPDDTGKWVHFGLTSSDVVETAHGLRFAALYRPMVDRIANVISALTRYAAIDQPMLGITHGQAAEPTSIRARAMHWISTVAGPTTHLSLLTRRQMICKLSGPVGTFAHNPPVIEQEVAKALELIPMTTGASQILPRTPLAMWANTVAVLLGGYSKICTDLRLMNLSSELYWPRAGTHVGSSAMVHKNNPIEAEQMSGFARMAQGYAQMLQPMDLWLERDISHSSVERVAVADLWHLLFMATERMVELLGSAELIPLLIEQNLANRANEAWSHKTTLNAIRDGMGWQEAREFALAFDIESYDILGDARQFMANYPKAGA